MSAPAPRSLVFISAVFLASASEAAADGTLAGLTINPDTVIGGETSQGTLSLTAPVGSDTVVTLSSTDTSVATVPASVTVPANTTSAVFTVTTKPVSGAGTFSWISGSAGGQTWGDSINVNPGAPASAPSIVSVTFAPSSVGGGGTSTGTIQLSGPANDGAIFSLTSSNPAIVQVPSEVVVSARSSSAAFSAVTSSVSTDTAVSVTASARCCGAVGSRAAPLTVTTAAPPQADIVRITQLRWRRCMITVRATSTNPNAILTLHSSSGAEMFRLNNLGGGNYAAERAWRAPGTNVPVTLTVRSNLGGSASQTVRDPEAGRCRADL
jgi:hypothetical protein